MSASHNRVRGGGAVVFGVSLSLLSACSSWIAHPALQPQPLSNNPLNRLPEGVSAEPLPDHWWQLYRDPALNQLVQDALEHNRDLEVASAHVDAMLAGIGQANAARWPSTQASVGASYGKTSDDQTLASATGERAPSQWEFNPGLELSYQVDIWGQVQRSIEQARYQAQAAQDAEDLLRTTVAAQTTRAYVNACAFAARAAVQRHSLEVVEQSLRLTDRQRQGGIVTDLEYLRMRALQSETLARLPLFEAQRQTALFELATLTGRSTQDGLSAAARCTTIPQLNNPLPTGDGWALVARRPDIRRAERVLQASSLQVDIAKADLYPKVSFGASLSSSSHRLDELGDSSSVMFGVGPLISWEFPNWQANRARVSRAQAKERGNLAQFESTVLEALKQVHQALAMYDGERQRHAALAQALDSSQQAYALAQLNYRAGSLDFLDVLDSERELIRLQATLADADSQLVARQIGLFQALGGGWQPSVQASTVPVNTSSAPQRTSGTKS